MILEADYAFELVYRGAHHTAVLTAGNDGTRYELLKILGAKLPVPETLVHRYLTATLHLRRERLVATCEDLWRMEVPFILKP
jgi:hypothetical protein